MLSARIEERYNAAFPKTAQIWPLRKIAHRAGKRSISRPVASTVLLRNNVIQVEGEKVIVVSMNVAILTTVASATPDKTPGSCIHADFPDSASNIRALDFRIATKVEYDT